MTPQTYEQWRTERAGVGWTEHGAATASVFDDIMDAKTPRKWRTLLGKIREEKERCEQGIFQDADAAALEWGRIMEPRALAAYSLATGYEYEPATFCRLEGWPVGASPDALVESDGLVEAKCPFSLDGFDRYVRTLGESAKWQCLGQIWVTGRQWCDLVVYDPRRNDWDQTYVLRFDRASHAADLARLEATCLRFAQYLVDGTEPAGGKFEEAA